jgi:hypothetical protein
VDDYDDSYLRDKVSDLEGKVDSLSAVVGSLLIGKRVLASTSWNWGQKQACPGGEGVVTAAKAGELTILLGDRTISRFVTEVSVL